MQHEDASQTGSTGHAEPIARADVDTLPPGSYGPATGNAITGAGTTTGASGADSAAPGAEITHVNGAGGQTTEANGNFQAQGQYGVLSMDAQGDFNYVRNPGTPDGVRDVFNYTLADANGASSSTTLTIDIGQVAAAALSQGVVALPAGVQLSDIHVNGHDLVIDMPNGTQMVIPEGAVFVPQLTIGDVQVPPTNLAALLIDSEPQPAAGPPQSSGGNFADPVPPLDPGVPLGDLIPPTELTYTPPEFRDVGQFENTKPTVIIETPDNPAGAVDASESVKEAGLPTRNGGEPAGSGEIADGNGSNNSDGSETNTGTIVFTAQDGLQSITVGGEAVTSVGQQISGEFGTMTITGIDIANGQITYSYTLLDNTSGDNTADHFTVVVTDSDGDQATGSLTVHIVDDTPTARADTDSLTVEQHSTDGNVMTGAGTDSGSAGADTVGADNAQVTSVSGAGGSDSSFDSNGNLVVHGQFGTLSIDASGNYTYVRDEGSHAGGVDTFNYTLTDGDGDTSTTTLKITVPHINEVPVAVPDTNWTQEDSSSAATGNVLDTINHPGAPSGTFSDNADTDADNDTLTVTSVNGGSLASPIGGDHGTLTIGANGAYSYQVNNADAAVQALGVGETLTDTFTYTVSDGQGGTSTATLTITIFGTNDAPTAVADTNWTVEDSSSAATGNVLDTINHPGAPSGTFGDHADTDPDAHDTLTVSAVNGSAGNVGTAVTGAHGTLTLNADGTYSYQVNNADSAVQALGVGETTTDTFQYTSSDGHGGTSTTTLTITIFGTNDAPTAVADTNWTQEDSSTAATGNVLDTINHPGAPSGTFGDNADTDPDAHDTLTVSAVNGSAGNVGTAVTGAHGTLTLNANGSYSYQVNNADSAVQALGVGETTTDTFQYTSSDGHGGTSTTTLTITIFGTNDAPTAVADTNWTVEDSSSAATGNVLDTINHPGAPSGTFGDHADTDPDAHDTLTVSAVNGSAGNVGTAVTGAHGTLTLNADGTYSYQVNNADTAVQALGVGETTTDTFQYTASDGHGGTSTTSLTITIFGTNDAPTAVADTNWTVEDSSSAATGNVLDTINHPGAPSGTFGDHADTDPDAHDTLTVTSVNGGSIASAITGTHGTLTMNADGSYSYQVNNADAAVQALGVGETTTDTFTYAVSDGHGGTASATLTITIFGTNDAPTAVADTNWTTGGSVTAATGNVLDTINHPGAPSGTFGDHADTDPDAHDVLTVTSVNGGSISGAITGAHGTLTMNADGTYSYQVNNADSAVQALGVGETTTDTFTYAVSDGHGGTASATLTITIFGANGAPTAVADTNWTQEDTSTTATGNVLDTINHPGAPSGTFGDHADTDPDAHDVLTVATVDGSAANVGTNVTGTYGTLHLNADGTYTYTLNNSSAAVQALGVGETTTDQFTYSVSDGHGGTASSTLTITIFGTNDAPTAVADTNWTQEDSSTAATGNVLDTINHPGAPSGTFGDNADTDPDAHDTLTVSAVNGSAANVGTAVTGAHGTLTLNANGTYSYQVNNADSAVQALGVGETTTDTFQYTSSDGHGGTSTTTLTITIFGTNDAPTAVADTNWTVEDSSSAATGNVLDTINHPGAPSGTFGDHADTDPDAHDTLTVSAVNGSAGNVGTAVTGAHGTLTLNADGTYSYQVNNADTAVQALSVGQTTTDTFQYTASDGHGGTSTTSLTITIFGTNDAPVVGTGTANVSEEGLIGANPDTTGSPDTTNAVVATGTISMTDVDTSDTHAWTLTAPANGSLTSNGYNVIWTGSGTNTLHAYQDLNGNGLVDSGEKAIATISIDNSGNYTVTLQGPIDHPTANVEDLDTFNVGVNVNDGHVTSTGTLTVNVEDDSPVNFTPDPQPTLADDGSASATGLVNDPGSNSTGVNFIGADGFGSLFFTGTAALDGTALKDASNTALTSHGQPILVTGYGTDTLTAYVDSGAHTGYQAGEDTVVFTVTLNDGTTYGSDATYTINFSDTIDNGSGVSFNNLTSTAAGNVDYRGVGADSTAQPIDILLSATSGGSIATVNTDSTAIGVGNQSLNTGDSVRIDFVSDLTSGGAGPTGFNFTGHDSSNGFVGFIPQVQGSQSQTVSFTVYALNTTLTQSGAPDSNPTGGFSDASVLTTTSVYAQDYQTGTTATLDISGLAVGSTTAVGSFGVTVTKNADGSVTFNGIQEGDHYGVTTSSDFNAIVVKDVSGSFDLGVFALSQTDQGHNIDMNFGVTAQDADGDTSTGTVAVTLVPGSTTTSSATLSTNTVTTMSTSSTSLHTSSLMATNDNTQHDQRAFNVGGNAALMGALAAAGLSSMHGLEGSHAIGQTFGHGPDLTPLHTASLGTITTETVSVVKDSHLVDHSPTVQPDHEPSHGAAVHDMVVNAHGLAGQDAKPAHEMTELLHGSEGHAHGPANAPAVTASTVIMPSAEQLAAAAGHATVQPQTSVAGNSAQHNEVVSKVLADALHGGEGHHGANIDALVHALPGHASGGNAALEALATHGAAAVSMGHMGFAGAFAGGHGVFSMDQMAHPDAAPAHA